MRPTCLLLQGSSPSRVLFGLVFDIHEAAPIRNLFQAYTFSLWHICVGFVTSLAHKWVQVTALLARNRESSGQAMNMLIFTVTGFHGSGVAGRCLIRETIPMLSHTTLLLLGFAKKASFKELFGWEYVVACKWHGVESAQFVDELTPIRTLGHGDMGTVVKDTCWLARWPDEFSVFLYRLTFRNDQS
jgi:hypothetical protein